MKIEKFNEKLDREISEPWTEDKFKKIENYKIEVEFDLLPLLKKYIILNQDKMGQDKYFELMPDCKVTEYQYYSYKNSSNFTLYYKRFEQSINFKWDLNKEKFQDLLIFLDNPESYKNSRKYNI